MEFKSQGKSTGSILYSRSQYSSYVISFTTQHTDSHEMELSTGSKNQQFSGISANIYSYQNAATNMFSRLYGEQRALNPADAAHPYAPLNPKDIIPNWQIGEDALAKINKDYLNNAQINALSSEIHNNAADPDALAKIVDQGNALNYAMKKLGNSIGQYDSDGSFAKYKEDITKASDRYKYANPDKKAAYDNATEVTKALINKDTGTYADQTTVETLTEAENKAWNELKVVLAKKTTPKVPAKEPVADPSHLTTDEQAKVQKNVEDANKDENGKSTLPEGTTVTVDDKGNATVTYPDHSTDTIKGSDLVRPATDAEKTTPKVPAKEPVADPSHLTTDEQAKVQKNVEDANKDENGKSTLPEGTTVTVGDDGTATIKYPDGSQDTIPGDQLVQGQKGDTTDAGKITPTVPGDKVTVKDPSHLTDDEKNQVKTNVTNANKDKFPAGTEVTVGDDGTATITYSDGSKDTIPGRDLIIGAKGEGISGNTAKSGSKNNSLKTLPQTGNGANEKASALGFLFAGLASIFSLAGRRKKKY
ncbi:hypothetical protein DN441_06060 [Lactobacillus reuteri]|nr:hypothetical protein [Limosilactobacillus reuteri]